MSKVELVNNKDHHKIKVMTHRSSQFGDDVSITGVFPSEFVQLQNEYVIFFKKNAQTGLFHSVVLLGFAEGENLYLENDNWMAEYMPLSILRAPFLIGFTEHINNGVPEQVAAVHIDVAHPRVNYERGEPLFLEHGGNSEYLTQINSVLQAIHHGHADDEAFMQSLLKYDLLESATLKVGSDTLTGLYTINEDNLRQLDASALEALHQVGYLQHIYMVMASLGQLKNLVNVKLNQNQQRNEHQSPPQSES
ncbi:multidrug transporter [Pseudoalteromonas citrea]|uniref:Multidrug transporter n=1 Tax=Pseudoalteromonas citrea TaxID=43655 RepID=A0A5S3XKE4_9GAMM|nr:SapC family protein [Pseudoalteromonas citrea]TMP40226.1 multidrug transporter [Pseudoalteromonas citrea]TMP55437.1 multidrug transporter [Pseudoalteromonas citrea]